MSFLIDHKMEFIHIPKTGGMWIENVCKPHIELVGNKGRHDTDRHVNNVRSFAVARSPYSWLKSCLGYTQQRWIIVEKNLPGWFQECPYREIGKLQSLRTKCQKMDVFVNEYLRKLPGEYTRATMEYYKNADVLIDFDGLTDNLINLMYRCKVPHAHEIEHRARETDPLNVSKENQNEASPELIERLNDVELDWYDYMEGKYL